MAYFSKRNGYTRRLSFLEVERGLEARFSYGLEYSFQLFVAVSMCA